MVAGADQLCEIYAKGQNQLTINITCTEKPISYPTTLYDELIEETPPKKITSRVDNLLWGRNYVHVDPNNEDKITRIWICPVTLFVLGRYPKYIYIQKKAITIEVDP